MQIFVCRATTPAKWHGGVSIFNGVDWWLLKRAHARRLLRRWSIYNHAGFMIVDPYRNCVVAGYRYVVSPEDVIEWCRFNRPPVRLTLTSDGVVTLRARPRQHLSKELSASRETDLLPKSIDL